jgi:hypothetical protein
MTTANSETYEDGVLVHSETITIPDPDPAEVAVVARWRGMGFTDEEITAMYPHLGYAVHYSGAQ